MDHEGAILDGTFDDPLIRHIPLKEPLVDIYNESKAFVYTDQRVIDIEAAGFEVIGGLLETFVSAANELVSGQEPSSRSLKYLQLLPKRYGIGESDPYNRALRLTDYVSGMTDSFAVALYKKIKGISLPDA